MSKPRRRPVVRISIRFISETGLSPCPNPTFPAIKLKIPQLQCTWIQTPSEAKTWLVKDSKNTHKITCNLICTNFQSNYIQRWKIHGNTQQRNNTTTMCVTNCPVYYQFPEFWTQNLKPSIPHLVIGTLTKCSNTTFINEFTTMINTEPRNIRNHNCVSLKQSIPRRQGCQSLPLQISSIIEIGATSLLFLPEN